MFQPTTTMGPRLQDLLGLWLSRRAGEGLRGPGLSLPCSQLLDLRTVRTRLSFRRRPAPPHPHISGSRPPPGPSPRSALPAAARPWPLHRAAGPRAPAPAAPGAWWRLFVSFCFCFFGGIKGESSWQRETKKERKRRKRQTQWKQRSKKQTSTSQNPRKLMWECQLNPKP